MGSAYVVNGSEEIIGMGYLEDGATIPVGKSLLNNGTYEGTPIVTSITAGAGISVTNPATPGAATAAFDLATVTNPIVTSITAGAGISVTNPTSPGAAIISANMGNNLGLSQYSLTNFNVNNFNFQGIFNLII